MHTVIIDVDREGNVKINGEKCLNAEIIQRLKSLQANSVLVRGDKNAPYMHVISVTKKCQGAGVKRIGAAVVGE